MNPFPPIAPTSVLKTIPSYLYVQYNDDDNLQAFVASYNQLAQNYVNWFNTINLPIYTEPTITGQLLDWVAAGIYGQVRPTLSAPSITTISGSLNSVEYDTTEYNQLDYAVTNGQSFATASASGTGSVATLTFSGSLVIPVGTIVSVAGVSPTSYNGTVIVTASSAGSISYSSSATGSQTVSGTITVSVYNTTDDYFKRILTWNFYKGDGTVFNMRWLKRRIVRFLNGVNGVDVSCADTSNVSVVIANDPVTSRPTVFNITVANGGTSATILIAAIQSRAVNLPFQYTYNVTVSALDEWDVARWDRDVWA